MDAKITNISEYFLQFTGEQLSTLRGLRDAFHELVPGAQETISYGMPTLKVGGSVLLHFGGFKDHNAIFPGSQVVENLSQELGAMVNSKGTIRLGAATIPKKSVLKRITEECVRELNSTFPKRSGEFKEFYLNGFLKSEGQYKDGLMQGKWDFYRKDGSLMRSGLLDRGEPVGKWQTHTRPSD